MNGYIELYSQVYFCRPDEGGRETPVFSGYKPSFFFGEHSALSRIDIEGKKKDEPVPLGQRHHATVILLARKELMNQLKPGGCFSLREGLKVVGEGLIERIAYREPDGEK